MNKLPEFKIPIAKTEFTEKDFEAILEPLKSGWVVQGPFVQEFEKKWCQYTGAKYSLATSSCTSALHVSLDALELLPGDEVIVPAFTWIATANVVEHLQAKVVFCDIDLKTYNINPNQIESKITSRTKAIIPVHLFGLSADMDPILEIAEKYRLYVIEDAACGFGAKYKNRHIGNFGIIGCFSFHPRKAITTGEGGMVTTNDESIYNKIKALRDHGATTSDLQRHLGNKPYLLPEFPYAGYNYRMTDIQASIGSSQMDRAEEIHEKRADLANRYDSFIDNIPWLVKPFRSREYEHGFQSYVCLFQPEKISIDNASMINKQRNIFMDYLQKNGISTRPGTHASHMLEYYVKKYSLKFKDFPNSYIADICSIALPLFPSLTNDEFEFISSIISEYKL